MKISVSEFFVIKTFLYIARKKMLDFKDLLSIVFLNKYIDFYFVETSISTVLYVFYHDEKGRQQ